MSSGVDVHGLELPLLGCQSDDACWELQADWHRAGETHKVSPLFSTFELLELLPWS